MMMTPEIETAKLRNLQMASAGWDELRPKFKTVLQTGVVGPD